MAVSTCTITGHILTPSGAPATGGSLTAKLSQPGSTLDGTESVRVAKEVTASISAAGLVTLALVPNDLITPVGTSYLVTIVAQLPTAKRATWSEVWQLTGTAALDIGSVPRKDAVPGVLESPTLVGIQAQADAAAASAASAAGSELAAIAAASDASLAMSAALSAGNIYPDTAAGLAAVADGEYFFVPVGGASDSMILYRDVAGVATEITRYPASALASTVATISPFYTTTAGKNLYNKDMVSNGPQDGKLYSTSTGAISSNTNWAISGRVALEPGKTYVMSIQSPYGPFATTAVFWDSGGTFAGSQATVVNVTASRSSDNRTWTIVVGAAATARWVGFNMFNAAHTGTDYTNALANMMMEEGSTATSFEAYGTTSTMPASPRVPNENRFRVVKEGNQYYLRFAWSSTYDLVILFELTYRENSVSNWRSAFLLPVAIPDLQVSFYNYGQSVIDTNGDDATPVRYNGIYIGSNHGHSQFRVATAAAHGKDATDIGSQWNDAGGRRFTIAAVPTTGTLWLIGDYTKSGDVYTFNTTLTSPLTHVSGAAHTTNITVSSSTTGATQLYPSVKNLTKSIILDGVKDITSAANGVYECGWMEVVNEYDITDFASVLDYLKAHPGAASTFTEAGIDSGSHYTATYRFAPNASCSVHHTWRTLKGVDMVNVGGTQAGSLSITGSRRLYQLVPGVGAFVGGTKTWNFDAIEETTAGVDTFSATSGYWSSATNPPNRMAQLLRESDGTTKVVNLMIGYSLDKGITVPATRKDKVGAAILLGSKMWPNAISYASTDYPAGQPSGNMAAGTFIEVVAWRAYWNPATNPNATAAFYWEDGTSAYVVLEYHSAATFETIPLPSRFRGRTVTALENTGITLHTSVVGPTGLVISSAARGSAVLKLA